MLPLCLFLTSEQKVRLSRFKVSSERLENPEIELTTPVYNEASSYTTDDSLFTGDLFKSNESILNEEDGPNSI